MLIKPSISQNLLEIAHNSHQFSFIYLDINQQKGL